MSRIVRTVLLALALTATIAEARNPKVGEAAPPLRMTLLDGSEVMLDSLRGQVVLINLWATWCAPCKAEMPLIDTYYRINKQHGLAMFAILTEGSVSPARLKPVDAALEIAIVKRKRGNFDIIDKAVPTTYMIDRGGIVRYAKAGVVTLDTLNEMLVPMLNTPAPAP